MAQFKKDFSFTPGVFMQNARRKLQSALSIALLAIWPNAFAQAQATDRWIPPALIGTWQVTSVHTDVGASRTPQYRQNDRRLVGRIFSISQERISTDTPEEDRCDIPRIATRMHTLNGLIEKSMAGRSFAPEQPTAEDYGLALPKGNTVDAFTLQCKDRLWGASLGRDDGIQGVWFVKLREDQLAIRWYDETILVLKRLPASARPAASFDCGRASIPSEKSICSSIALASLDTSITNAYAAALKRFSSERESHNRQDVTMKQRAWVLQRNKCAADAACLHKTMSSRLNELEALSAED